MARTEFYPPEEVDEHLERILASSVADETEVVWLDRRHGWASRGKAGSLENPRLTAMVRVVEHGRQGWFRTDTGDANLLEDGVRHALALAKSRDRLDKRPLLPRSGSDDAGTTPALYDEAIAGLKPAGARARVEELGRDKDRVRLSWSESRLVIANSHGLRRSAAATEATLEIELGRLPGAGRATASARFLDELDTAAVRERAERVHGVTPPEGFTPGDVPALLSSESTIELLNVLNAFALSGRTFLDGTSFLSRYRNVQVFDRALGLRDDGTAPGLPFPFDFEGSSKRPIDLILEGKPSTPALSRIQGALAGLEPTAQSVGGQDSLFGNLFLGAGEAAEDELLAAADGGLYIGWLDRVECFEPAQLRIRAIARGVRRIENGALGATLPDLVWEESLLRALARLKAVGRDTVIRAMPTTPLGGISAPALVLAEIAGLRAESSSPQPPSP